MCWTVAVPASISPRERWCRVLVSTDQVAQQVSSLALRNSQHTKPEVEDVDRSSLIEVPAVPRLGGERHLSRC